MHKKAQFWYADFLLAILILVGISFLFIRTITDLNSKQDKIQGISSDAFSISNSFMSKGYCPSNCGPDWSNLNGNIGFVREGKVIQTNLDDLISLTSTSDGYDKSKIILGTKNNYIFYFEDNNQKIFMSGEEIFGNPLIDDISKINSNSLVKVTRFVYLDTPIKKLVRLVIIVW